MCLKKVKLNLTWDEKEKKYIGVGYKKLNDTYISQYKLNKWHRATGTYGSNFFNLFNDLKNNKTFSNSYLNRTLEKEKEKRDTQIYHPGFHIFLEKQAAEDYYHVIFGDVYKVIFYNVLSYGINESKYDNYRPCVVTEYMKIIGKI